MNDAHLDVGHARGRERRVGDRRARPRAQPEARARSARRAGAFPETPGGAGSDRRRTARTREPASVATSDLPGTRSITVTSGAGKRRGCAAAARPGRRASRNRRASLPARRTPPSAASARRNRRSSSTGPPSTRAEPPYATASSSQASMLHREVERPVPASRCRRTASRRRARRPADGENRGATSRPRPRAGRSLPRRDTMGKRGKCAGDRDSALPRPNAGSSVGDPIDERERAELIGHQHLAPPVSPRLARRAARARRACRTSPA